MDDQININAATAQEISQLYEIGPALADRVVSYRDSHSYFHGPEDLAKVEGISPELAQVLSPHIDWSVPEEPGQLKERDWVGMIFTTLFILVFSWLLLDTIDSLADTLSLIQQGVFWPYSWVGVWIHASLVLIFSFALLYLLGQVAVALTRNSRRAGRIERIAALSGVPLLICAISLGLANAAYYQFYAPNGWADLFRNSPAIVGLVGCLAVFLLMGPYILAIFRPDLATKPIFVRAYDTAAVVSAPLLIAFVWTSHETLPIWVLLIYGFIGLTQLWGGVLILRGYSPYKELLRDASLQRALDVEFQPSRKLSIKGAKGGLLVGLGGWLLLTVAKGIFGPVIQHGVQQVMDYYNVSFF